MSFQEPAGWGGKAAVRDFSQTHQIGFQIPKRKTMSKTGLGVQVTCNCSWKSSRCVTSLEDAWDLYLSHDYLYEVS